MDAREETVNQALLQVCDGEDFTRGTGFLVSREGHALTCYHVVAGLERVRVRTHDGRLLDATLEAEEELAPFDLALLRCEDTGGRALPIEADFAGVRTFWSKGFHFQDRGLRGAVPVKGEINPGGPLPITYPDPRVERLYKLPGALVLTGDDFDHGISGAPLVDSETGVAVGVINTHLPSTGSLRGCALPLGLAARASPTLARQLKHNQDTLPRFGRYINALGARELCARQARAAVTDLQNQGQYLPDVFCERPGALKVLEAFLAGEARLFPLLGDSGVGKTTLLVHLASTGELEPVVLLLADDIEPGMEDLSAMLRHALAEVSQSGPVDLPALLRALDKAGTPLTVLLDALDRATARLPVQGLQHWLGKTQKWLNRSRTRLIVSCRPEWWSYLRAPLGTTWLDTGSGGRKQAGFQLGDFSGEEVKWAQEAYGLSATHSPALRHPLMLRMLWETQRGASDQGGPPVSRMALFERFLDIKCLNVAARLNGSPGRSHLRHLLSRVAEATLAEHGYSLRRQDFYALLPSPVGEELIREHLFHETTADLRFTFDEVAEYLQSEFIKLPDALHGTLQGDRRFRNLSDGPLVFALLRLEQAGRTEALRASLEALAALESRKRARERGRAFERVFAELTHPSPYFELARKFAEDRAKAWRLSWSRSPRSEPEPESSFESLFLLWMLREARFTLEERLTLLHIILPAVADYPWREKDRDRQEKHLASEDKVAVLLSTAITESPRRAFAVLVTWLGDERRLEGDEATVADVARACLLHRAALDMEGLCGLLVKNPRVEGRDAWTVLYPLSQREPRLLAPLCQRWARSGEPKLEAWAAHCGLRILDTSDEPARAMAREALAHLLTQAREPDVRMEAAEGLNRFDDTRAQVLATLEEAFRRGDPMVTARTFAPALHTHFSEILDLLTQSLLEQSSDERVGWDHSRRVADAIAVLLSYDGPLKHQRALVHRLREVLAANPGIVLRLAFHLELRLYNVKPTVARASGLLGLAEHLIRGHPAKVRSYFITVAYGRSAWSGSTRSLAKPLRALFEELEDDPTNLGRMFSETHDNAPGPDVLFALLESVARRLGQQRFEAMLISRAFIDARFAKGLSRWLEHQQVIQPRYQVRAFLDALRGGLSPFDAAEQAYHLPQEEPRT